MTRLDDDPIPALDIRGVKFLCQELGLTTVSQKKFRVSVTNWRKSYKTASGKRGTALLDWESDVERYELGVMAQQFIETGSNINDFWPADGGSSAQVSLRYTKDKFKIIKLVRRVMWRQNKYLAETNIGVPAESLGVMGVPLGIYQNLPSPLAPHGFGLPPPLPASFGSPRNLYPGSTNSAPTNDSSNLSPINRHSKEEDMRGQSSQQKRSHPLPLDSTNVGSESNKRKRTASPAEHHGASLQLPTNTPSNFRPGDTNLALTTATSRNSGDGEENIQDQTSQLHSTSSIPASDLKPLNDLDDEENGPRNNVQLDSLDNPQSQIGPSPNESGPSKTAKAGFPTSTTRSEVDIFIVESSGPRFSMKEWPGGSLRGRTLEFIFNEVTTAFPGQALQRIKFQLETLKMENAMECLIERDDDKIFGAMMQKFKKRIKERKEAGETKFKLYLEVDRGVQEAAVSEALESEEDDL